jgi:hypothetical protein
MIETRGEAHAGQQCGGLRLRVLRCRAPHQQWHGDVLERRELRQQMMKLVDEPDRLITQAPTLRVVQLIHGGTRDFDRAACR